MKLLMQPLTSINVRTEALLLTKVEVWWYLVIQLGPNLSPNFDQVRFPVFSKKTKTKNKDYFIEFFSLAVLLLWQSGLAAAPHTCHTDLLCSQ